MDNCSESEVVETIYLQPSYALNRKTKMAAIALVEIKSNPTA